MLVLIHIDLVFVLSKLCLETLDVFAHIIGHHYFGDGIRNILHVSLVTQLILKVAPCHALLGKVHRALIDLGLLLSTEGQNVLESLPHNSLYIDPLG